MINKLTKLIFILLIGALSLNAFSWQKIGGGASSPPTNGLVAFYQCENNVLDTQGSYNGTATDITYGTGKSGQACVFNGSTSKIALPYSFLASRASWTMSFWAKVNTTGETTVYSDSGYVVDFTNNFNLFKYSSGISGTDYRVAFTPDGTFHHFVVTNNNGSYKIYIDSGEKSITTNGHNYATTSTPSLGTYGGGYYYFNGSLDSVRFYNRALDASEILAIYQAGN